MAGAAVRESRTIKEKPHTLYWNGTKLGMEDNAPFTDSSRVF